MNLHRPGSGWRLLPVRDDPCAFYFDKPPNWFHRLMQRLIFGFRWERRE